MWTDAISLKEEKAYLQKIVELQKKSRPKVFQVNKMQDAIEKYDCGADSRGEIGRVPRGAVLWCEAGAERRWRFPLSSVAAEYVCEYTSVVSAVEKTRLHLKADARKVVFFVFTEDDSCTIVMGANQQIYESSVFTEAALLHY